MSCPHSRETTRWHCLATAGRYNFNKYKIIRFTFDDNRPDNHTVNKTGLTEKEAQEHCQREDTRKEGVWFHGYTKE